MSEQPESEILTVNMIHTVTSDSTSVVVSELVNDQEIIPPPELDLHDDEDVHIYGMKKREVSNGNGVKVEEVSNGNSVKVEESNNGNGVQEVVGGDEVGKNGHDIIDAKHIEK